MIALAPCGIFFILPETGVSPLKASKTYLLVAKNLYKAGGWIIILRI